MKSATGKIRLLPVLVGLLVATAPAGAEEVKPFDYRGGWEKDHTDTNVRVMRHQDGSRTEFRRTPDDRTITKKTTGTNGYLRMTAVYRMDAAGNPRGAKIYDGKGAELFKVSYGYDKTTGLLVAERMFDARARFLDPATGDETPVRILYYSYDAQGNRSKALAINPLTEGLTAEDVYGDRSTFPETNPFKE